MTQLDVIVLEQTFVKANSQLPPAELHHHVSLKSFEWNEEWNWGLVNMTYVQVFSSSVNLREAETIM